MQGHSQPDDQPGESQTSMSVTNVCHTESESEENTWYEPVAEPLFTWGPHDGHAFGSIITSVYNEVVHWRPNLFLVPFGKVGKQFVREMAKLFRTFAECSTIESVALKAAMVLPILTLQRPYRNSKAKTHSQHLERRLTSWLNGDIQHLLKKGQTIQARCGKFSAQQQNTRQKQQSKSEPSRKFANLMFQEKCSAALSILTEKKTTGVLHPNSTTPSGETVATRSAQVQTSSPSERQH